METLKSKMSEQLLDAAACEALGANTPAESAVYQQELAGAGDDARRMDWELRETVARLSSASPYLKPSADLRGRILQASAPVTFRMEDYRKAVKDNSRFYKWGFYAAMLFLSAGAIFNITTRDMLTKSNQSVAALKNHIKETDNALMAFVNPKSQPITLTENGKAYGKALVDPETMTAVVLLPKGMVPEGKSPQMSITDADGKVMAFKTVLIEAPGDFLVMPQNKSIETVLRIQDLAPDGTQRPQVAGKR
jgi:hypothetical protein